VQNKAVRYGLQQNFDREDRRKKVIKVRQNLKEISQYIVINKTREKIF